MSNLENDKATIARLGGPTKVAELLHYDTKKGGVQRVQNWLTRGIPPQVKLDYPDLFQQAAVAAGEAMPAPTVAPLKLLSPQHKTAKGVSHG